MYNIEELKYKVGVEGLCGRAGIEIFIEEAEALKEYISHDPNFLIIFSILQKTNDNCNSSGANIVPPIAQMLISLFQYVNHRE